MAISLQVTDIYTYRLAHLVISNGYLIAVSYSETLGFKLTASIILLQRKYKLAPSLAIGAGGKRTGASVAKARDKALDVCTATVDHS